MGGSGGKTGRTSTVGLACWGLGDAFVRDRVAFRVSLKPEIRVQFQKQRDGSQTSRDNKKVGTEDVKAMV